MIKEKYLSYLKSKFIDEFNQNSFNTVEPDLTMLLH